MAEFEGMAEPEGQGGLLEGMRVLDASIWRPMPHATQILCDLGAEVTKIEPPGGDPMRAFPELFASLARGKRSVVLDLKSDDGRARALELVAQSDVFCEGWRPGVADRLGLGADTLRAMHPSLIYCSISGYGQTGPWRDEPGHDLNYQALGGALMRAGDDGSIPATPRLPVADLEAGTIAALMACAAWARRLQTGLGERIDIAMADVVNWWVGPSSSVAVGPSSTAAIGSDTARSSGWPGYGVFPTVDHQLISLAPLSEPGLWLAICRALELDDLTDLTLVERLDATDDINRRVAARIATMTSVDALDRLRAEGAPVAPVLTPEEAAAHPHFQRRGRLVDASGIAVPGLPAHLAVHRVGRNAPVPAVGEHDHDAR